MRNRKEYRSRREEADCCRPGGFSVTEELLAQTEKYHRPDLREPLNVLDIGCGNAATLRWLAGRYPDWKLTGLDPAVPENAEGDPETGREPAESADRPPEGGDGRIRLVRGRGEELPFPDSTFDLVFMECSFSRTGDPERVLAEIRRVLRKDGKLLVSDLYSRAAGTGQEKRQTAEPEGNGQEERREEAPEESARRPAPEPEKMDGGRAEDLAGREPDCRIGRLETDGEIMDRLRRSGYGILEFQDCSRVLGDWVAQRILDGEAGSPEEILGCRLQDLKRRKCGYYYGVFEVSPLWDTVAYAAEHSPFYRRRLPPGGGQELRKLPFTFPEDIRRNPEEFLCVPPKEIARVITLRTSGSTDRPKRLFFTEEDLERTADFFAYGIRWLAGPGDTAAVFMEGPTHFSVGGLLKEALSRFGAEASVFGFIGDYAEAARQAAGADCLIGVPSQMYRLGKAAPGLRPKTVLLSADYVPESVKRFLEETWRCRVFTHWGMTETGYGGGVQCSAREGYHLRDEDLLAEILDPDSGEPVEPGCYGELTVTTFHRRGMPLIRYRTGDLGRMITTPCPCGCRKPRLDKVMGRIGEGVRLPDGRFLTIQMLDEVLYGVPGLTDYRAVWDPESGTLEIAAEGENPEEGVREACSTLLGDCCRLEIRRGSADASDGVRKRRITVRIHD